MSFQRNSGRLSFRLKGFVSISVLQAALLAAPVNAVADEVVPNGDTLPIADGESVTEVGNPFGRAVTLGGGNRVTNEGIISATTTNHATGIFGALGANNNIITSGEISAEVDNSSGNGLTAAGIRLFNDNNTVENSGSVSGVVIGNTGRASGITMEGETNSITNSNTIKATFNGTSGRADGVRLIGEETSFNNDGEVTAVNIATSDDTDTAESNAAGAYLESSDDVDTDISNIGSIEATSNANSTGGGLALAFSDGIDTHAEDDIENSTIDNSNTIKAEATSEGDLALAFADGIDMYAEEHIHRNTITNAGTIDAIAMATSADNGFAFTSADGIDMDAEDIHDNIIENSGTIRAQATSEGDLAFAFADGIDMYADDFIEDNSITNTDTIEATAKATSTDDGFALASAGGIDMDAEDLDIQDNIIENSGTIRAQATSEGDLAFSYAYGIDMYAENDDIEDNLITNTGTISVEAISTGDLVEAEAVGIYLHADERIEDNLITNTGTISAKATATSTSDDADAYAAGLDIDTSDDLIDNTINNSGTIRADARSEGDSADAHADGIDFDQNNVDNEINNSGTIIANAQAQSTNGEAHAQARGIHFEVNDGKITNTGFISATANAVSAGGEAEQEAFGVYIEGDNNKLENSGTIFADLGDANAAIYVEGDDGEVSLLNGSLIQGRIVIDGDDNTLKVGDGYDAVWTITGDMDEITIVDDGQTRFEVGNKVVTLSSDNIAAAQAASSQLALDLTRSLAQTIESRQAVNQTCKPEGKPCQTGAWMNANAFGHDALKDQDHDRTTATLTFGYDRALGETGFGGIYAGYASGRVYASQSSWDNESQTGYVGGYYNRTFGNLVTALNVVGGVSWNESTQTYLDNTVLGGIAHTDTQSENYFASKSATLGYEFGIGNGTLTPSLTGRYTFARLNGASEDAIAGLKMNNQNVHDLNARIQLAYSRFGKDEETGTSWNFRLRGGVDLYRTWGDDVGFDLGDDLVTLASYDDTSGSRPFIGVDVDFQLNDKVNLDFGFEAAYDSVEAISGQGRLGLAMKF